jgi:far upstream element-binding protein
MSEGDGPPGPWSDEGAARETRQGARGGDYTEEIIPCSGLGPGRVIGKRGSTVMRLQDETGARIEVKPEDGQCFVSGTPEQVTLNPKPKTP